MKYYFDKHFDTIMFSFCILSLILFTGLYIYVSNNTYTKNIDRIIIMECMKQKGKIVEEHGMIVCKFN